MIPSLNFSEPFFNVYGTFNKKILVVFHVSYIRHGPSFDLAAKGLSLSVRGR